MVYEQLTQTQLIWLTITLYNKFLKYLLKFSPPNPQIINKYVNGGANNDLLSPMPNSQMITFHLELMKVYHQLRSYWMFYLPLYINMPLLMWSFNCSQAVQLSVF